MPYAVITGVLVPGACDVALMGRARSQSTGQLVTQATVSSIAWTLTDTTAIGGPTLLASGTFAAATSIFNAPVVDAGWTWALQGKDTVGYNFRGIIAAASIPLSSSGDRLVADVKITMTSGEVLRGQFNWPTVQVYG